MCGMWGVPAGDVARRASCTTHTAAVGFQMVFRMRSTKEVLSRRGLLASTHARAGGPVLDAQDRRELRDAACASSGTPPT